MQRVSNHRFTDSTWTEARYYGGTLNRQLPLYVVAHDTAGRTAAGTVAYLADDPRGKVSYHAIIDRNGAVTQMVPLDRAAHHAGVSAHPDKPWLIGLNRCSIGVAFDNPGKLDQDGRAWFGHQYESAVYAERDDQFGKWLPYTAAQLDAFEDIVTALDRGYGIDGVFSHYQVATPLGRKADTNPTLDGFLRAMNHSVEDKAADMPLSERAVVNAAGGLNLRSEPGRHGPIIETMPIWTGVNVEPPVLANKYVLVTTDAGQTGWCHSAYLQGT